MLFCGNACGLARGFDRVGWARRTVVWGLSRVVLDVGWPKQSSKMAFALYWPMPGSSSISWRTRENARGTQSLPDERPIGILSEVSNHPLLRQRRKQVEHPQFIQVRGSAGRLRIHVAMVEERYFQAVFRTGFQFSKTTLPFHTS